MSLPQIRVSENNLKREINRLETNETKLKRNLDMEKEIIRQSLVKILDVKSDPVRVTQGNLLRRSDDSMKSTGIPLLPMRPKTSGPRMCRRHSLPASMLSLNYDSTHKLILSKSYGGEVSHIPDFNRLADPGHFNQNDTYSFKSDLRQKSTDDTTSANQVLVNRHIFDKDKSKQRRNSVSAVYMYRHRDQNGLQRPSSSLSSSMFDLKIKPNDLSVDELPTESDIASQQNLAPWEEEDMKQKSALAASKLRQKVKVMSPVKEDTASDDEPDDDSEEDTNECIINIDEVEDNHDKGEENTNGNNAKQKNKIRKKKKIKQRKKPPETNTKVTKGKQSKRDTMSDKKIRSHTTRQPEKQTVTNNNQRISSAQRRFSISNVSGNPYDTARPSAESETYISRRRKSVCDLKSINVEDSNMSRELRRSIHVGNMSTHLKLHLMNGHKEDKTKSTIEDKVWNDVRNCRYLRGYTPPSMRPIHGEIRLIDSDDSPKR